MKFPSVLCLVCLFIAAVLLPLASHAVAAQPASASVCNACAGGVCPFCNVCPQREKIAVPATAEVKSTCATVAATRPTASVRAGVQAIVARVRSLVPSPFGRRSAILTGRLLPNRPHLLPRRRT